MQPHSSQTQHQPRSLPACSLFHININVTNLQQAQFSKCCEQICDTVTNIQKIYICPFRQTYVNIYGQSDACLIKHISYQQTIN